MKNAKIVQVEILKFEPEITALSWSTKFDSKASKQNLEKILFFWTRTSSEI